ncbi:MAG: transposase, partial [Dysgonamonadaceae bacterium]|nr:transposase [Dysgonamonadaceae bacterium]
MIKSKQQSLNDVYTDCLESFENDKPKFLSMLEEHLDIDALIPLSFRMHFRKRTGRPREYLLSGFILALIIQRIFSIQTDTLLILFLTYSKELREFCGFHKVPDASKFTRFKQDFKDDLKAMFDNLVDLTEPICQDIDSNLASMTIFDTSGIEAYVQENNPKFINALIKRLKTWKAVKGLDDSYDPYKAAYGLMPSHAEADPAIKQMYINGHFCYSYKFGMITNGLGIVRDISFYDENYYLEHPEIQVSKKDDSPDEDKSLA